MTFVDAKATASIGSSSGMGARSPSVPPEPDVNGVISAEATCRISIGTAVRIFLDIVGRARMSSQPRPRLAVAPQSAEPKEPTAGRAPP
jgi:hypothetical protein